MYGICNSLKFHPLRSNKLNPVIMWKKFDCREQDLNLQLTLSGGQSFRWHKNDQGEWIGVFGNRIWTLKKDSGYLMYRSVGAVESEGNTVNTLSNENDEEMALKSYFRLDVPLDDLYEEWSSKDFNFRLIRHKYYGVRLLQQDPTENLFAFICSSNNNIARISMMVEKLCTLYGTKIGTVDGTTYHTFPSIKSLSDPSVELALRSAGFGYRAKYIQESAAIIVKKGGEEWLHNLSKMSYEVAKAHLMILPGVGAKVADCVCLMSLNHLQAVPVDTHVWQISSRYMPHLKEYKSLTSKAYSEIVQYFQTLYGPLAGWAHTVLFCADLKKFSREPKKKAENGDDEQSSKKQKT